MRGCYGSLLVYKPSSPTCSKCPKLDECGKESTIRTHYLFPVRDDNAPLMEEPKDNQALNSNIGNKLGKRNQAVFKSLVAKGVTPDRIVEDISSGLNPLRRSKKPYFLWAAFEELVNHGLFRKAELTEKLKERGISYSTASSNVSDVSSILQVMGADVSFKQVNWRKK